MSSTMTPPRGPRKIGDMEDSHLLLAQLTIPDQVEPIIREGTSIDLDKYLDAVDKLQTSIIFFDRNRHLNSCEGALRHARQLLTLAMQSLQEDFYEMLGSSSGFVDPAELREQLDGHTSAEPGGAAAGPLPELLFPEATPVLHLMAKRLMANGCGHQCAKSYRDRRANALQRNLERLGVEKLTKREIHDMPWEELDLKIRQWIEHLQIGVKLLLAGERELCDQILAGLDPFRERCFAELAGGATQWLLSFGEAVADSKKSPEKLFALLDMHDTLKGLLPQVESMFDGPTGIAVRKAMAGLLKALATASRATFDEFELAVEHNETDPMPVESEPPQHRRRPSLLSRWMRGRSRADDSSEDGGGPGRSSHSGRIPADGGVHPLTSYVVNYVKLLANSELSYISTLRAVFGEATRQQDGSYKSVKLASAVSSIMLALTKNLHLKAKQHRDPCMQEIFLMNNFCYMVYNISMSDAGELLGANWLRRHRGFVEQNRDGYITCTWAKFEHILSGEKGDVAALAKRLKAFNNEFQNLQQRQAGAVIVDPELRLYLRKVIQLKISEAYRNFIRSHIELLESNRSLSKYHMYTPQDLEKQLEESFLSISRSTSNSKRGS